MCGIAGIALRQGGDQAAAVDAVTRMSTRMRLRGPDSEGCYSSEGMVMGHRRLAILDLDARANQPLVSVDGRYVIIFNGEIYNFRELRHELEGKGVTFRTSSDTEVIVVLYSLLGAAMLSRLRGMFAFAIWDIQSRELFLARDPFGIKPLYYTQSKDGVLFASQVKALLASGLVSSAREAAGLAGFYLWGSVPEPWTLFQGILAVPAGHWIKISNGKISSPVCWHDIRQHWQGQGVQLSGGDLQELVRYAVTDSVRQHLVSDVPLSLLLSGGIDSAVVAGLATELGAQVKGITLGFEEFIGNANDEVPDAGIVASHFGLQHHVRRVSRAEFEEDIPRIFDAMDQPSIDGVNTWFASKAVAELGYKVVLSGLGGDELFFGYSSFRQIPRAAAVGRVLAAIPGLVANLASPVAWLAKHQNRPKLRGLPAFIGSLEGYYFLQRCLFLPQELPAIMGSDLALEGLARLGGDPPGMEPAGARDAPGSIGLLESTLYMRNQLLRDSDWAGMAHSLEMRTPFVDIKLLEGLGPYTSGFVRGAGKMMLAKSPQRPLPATVVNRTKTGFSTPISQWLSNPNSVTNLPKTASGEPWARCWARIVSEAMTRCV